MPCQVCWDSGQALVKDAEAHEAEVWGKECDHSPRRKPSTLIHYKCLYWVQVQEMSRSSFVSSAGVYARMLHMRSGARGLAVMLPCSPALCVSVLLPHPDLQHCLLQ